MDPFNSVSRNERNLITLLSHSLLPKPTSPFVFSAVASRCFMDTAASLSKDHLHLHNKHSASLGLLNAGNIMRQTLQIYRMHLVLPVPHSVLFIRKSVRLLAAAPSNERQHEECCPIATAKHILGQRGCKLGCSPIFHLLVTHFLESSRVPQAAFAR